MDRARPDRRSLLLGAAAAVSIPSTGRSVEAAVRILVVASGDFHPFNIERPDGTIGGIYADAIRMVADRLGWAFAYVPIPWARAQEMVRQGLADAFITLPIPERREYMHFTETPLLVLDRGVLVTHRDHPQRAAIEAVSDFDGLKAFSIATYIGDGWARRLWADWPNVRWARDLGASVRMLASQHVALQVQARELVQHQARKLETPVPFVYRAVDFVPDATNAFHFGIRRDFPDAEALVAAFGREQEALRAAGMFDTILAAYM